MNKISHQNLANNLADLLAIHKLSIDKLANLIDIPSMTIRRLVSGETVDPRISTLQLIANHFHISLDSLMGHSRQTLLTTNEFNQYNVPIISWDMIEKFMKAEIPLEMLTKKQLIAISKKIVLNNLFAIESKPSMYSLYPHGTIFIIAPEVKPIDGDLVLINFIEEKAIALKKLHIDTPYLYLHQVTQNNNVIQYTKNSHNVLGVVVLTLLYNHDNVI